MYLNFNLILEKGFEPNQMVLLQAIKQNSTEDLSNLIPMLIQSDRDLEKLKEGGYIKLIKGKKGQSEFERLRIDSKGTKLLEDIQTAETEDQDIQLRDWLVKFYKSEDKLIGNKKRIASGIAHFRKYTNIEKNSLAFLLKTFIFDSENMEYNNKLEKVFYSSNNVFSRRFNIDECRLYTYYEKRKDWFNMKFLKL